MTFGLHRERPTHDWGPELTERCHRVWWTVYVLDRTFSSSMGVPITIQDVDITTPMPEKNGLRRNISLYLHVKLSSLISEVVNSTHAMPTLSFLADTCIEVYGAEGRLQTSFLPCVHKVLGNIASIASDLNGCCPLSSDGSDGGISRVAAHLHLFYHQVCQSPIIAQCWSYKYRRFSSPCIHSCSIYSTQGYKVEGIILSRPEGSRIQRGLSFELVPSLAKA
jgi:hypothetical protein